MLPPPEKPEAVRQRTLIILSFWAVILFLGLPTWWKTTSIPRAALPIQDMLKWETEHHSYTVNIQIAAPDLACETAAKVVADVQTELDNINEFGGFTIKTYLVSFEPSKHSQPANGKNQCNVPKVTPGSETVALDVQLKLGEEFAMDITDSDNIATFHYSHHDVQSIASKLVHSIRATFADEQASVAYQYVTRGLSSPAIDEYVARLPQETVGSVQRSAARAFKPAQRYHLTFSLFAAEGTPSSWDIESITKQYIQPLTHSLSSAANFSITSQIQLYSAFSPSIQPFEMIDEEGWFLREQDLTAFINTAEWPLSPSIDHSPTINFVLYVPQARLVPLRIEGNRGGSWLIPQWGGINILNPPVIKQEGVMSPIPIEHLDTTLLKPAFENFRTQLLSLLGVASGPHLPLRLRLKTFQRLSGLSHYLRTATNLGSLARLSQRLSNIPIPHHVSDLVQIAALSLETYRKEGLSHFARKAYVASEIAFFDKSMVGQVYFPDEHKVAVYLPLLGPVGVPLVVALVREIKLFLAKRRS